MRGRHVRAASGAQQHLDVRPVRLPPRLHLSDWQAHHWQQATSRRATLGSIPPWTTPATPPGPSQATPPQPGTHRMTRCSSETPGSEGAVSWQ